MATPTLRLPRPRKLPWKPILIALALGAALALGYAVATLLSGSGSSAPESTQSTSPSAEGLSRAEALSRWESEQPWAIKPTPNAYGQVIETEAMRRMAPHPVSPTPIPYVRNEERLSELPTILWPKDVAQMGYEKILQLAEEQRYLLVMQPSGRWDILTYIGAETPPYVLLVAVDEWNKQPDRKERQAEIVPFLEERVLTKR